jgi:hypothetical protein
MEIHSVVSKAAGLDVRRGATGPCGKTPFFNTQRVLSSHDRSVICLAIARVRAPRLANFEITRALANRWFWCEFEVPSAIAPHHADGNFKFAALVKSP